MNDGTPDGRDILFWKGQDKGCSSVLSLVSLWEGWVKFYAKLKWIGGECPGIMCSARAVEQSQSFNWLLPSPLFKLFESFSFLKESFLEKWEPLRVCPKRTCWSNSTRGRRCLRTGKARSRQSPPLPLGVKLRVGQPFSPSPVVFCIRGITQVNNVHTLYMSQNHDFGVTCKEFEALIQSAVPEGKVAAHRLIKTFDAEAANLVDILEVLCGLTVSCTADLPTKVQKIFELFDFSKSSKVTFDELFIMVFSALRSMVRLQGKGTEPEDSDVEKMVDEIFLKFDREPSQVVKLDEFVEWFMEEGNFGIKRGQLKKITMHALMVKFDVLDEEDAKEIEQQRLLMIANQPVKANQKKKHSKHGGHKREGGETAAKT